MSTLATAIEEYPKILAEFAIAERLRRQTGIELHPSLFNTPLIYGPEDARQVMTSIYGEYLTAAENAALPMLLTAPTWRLDADRVEAAGVPKSINSDAVSYLRQVAADFDSSSPVLVGALTGPKNDCYRPDLAPAVRDAEVFHARQIGELSATDADFLLAQTMPSVDEALGVARAMATSGKPYLISFCTGLDGKVLDGTSLTDAMRRIDDLVDRRPNGYFVNCTHPSFLQAAYPASSLKRLIGIQANASSKDVTKLDGSGATESDPIDHWAASMTEFQRSHEVPILGGCCGTTLKHLQLLLAELGAGA